MQETTWSASDSARHRCCGACAAPRCARAARDNTARHTYSLTILRWIDIIKHGVVSKYNAKGLTNEWIVTNKPLPPSTPFVHYSVARYLASEYVHEHSSVTKQTKSSSPTVVLVCNQYPKVPRSTFYNNIPNRFVNHALDYVSFTTNGGGHILSVSSDLC